MLLSLEYYQRPFLYFYKEIAHTIKTDSNYLRDSFWKLVPEREYQNIRAQQLIQAYSITLEQKAKSIIEKYCIAYWLHLSRRIGVGSGGENKEPVTIMINRFNVLALIQKFAKKENCGHVGNSKDIPIEQIFNGLLLSPDFEIEREIILSHPSQLVFTDFTHLNLYEYYTLENIGYELWICGATLRSIGKGSTLIVNHSLKRWFYEPINEELDFTIKSYDKRIGSFNCTETGTVFKTASFDETSEVFIPHLNYSHISYEKLDPFIALISHFQIKGESSPNFILIPFPIKKYLSAHLPFSDEFYRVHKVSFKSIVFCLASLCISYFLKSSIEKKPTVLHILQRGYEGPENKAEIINEIYYMRDYSKKLLDLEYNIEKDEILLAFEFLELKDQDSIDLFNLGTLKFLVPAIDNRYYLDYTVIPSLLDSLFAKISLNEYNFRGDLLEKSIGIKSDLLTKPLKNLSGKEKQIDFAILIKNILILAECKVVAKSSSYFKGSYKSINYRKEKVVIRGLREADEKAKWLAKHPKGLNYNIIGAEFILPIAVSSFIEYIHSKDEYYWINEEIPRVLSIEELIHFINNFENIKITNNLIKIEAINHDK